MFDLKRWIPLVVRCVHMAFMFSGIYFFAVRLGFPNTVGLTAFVTISAVFLSQLFCKYFESLGNSNN